MLFHSLITYVIGCYEFFMLFLGTPLDILMRIPTLAVRNLLLTPPRHIRAPFSFLSCCFVSFFVAVMLIIYIWYFQAWLTRTIIRNSSPLSRAMARSSPWTRRLSKSARSFAACLRFVDFLITRPKADLLHHIFSVYSTRNLFFSIRMILRKMKCLSIRLTLLLWRRYRSSSLLVKNVILADRVAEASWGWSESRRDWKEGERWRSDSGMGQEIPCPVRPVCSVWHDYGMYSPCWLFHKLIFRLLISWTSLLCWRCAARLLPEWLWLVLNICWWLNFVFRARLSRRFVAHSELRTTSPLLRKNRFAWRTPGARNEPSRLSSILFLHTIFSLDLPCFTLYSTHYSCFQWIRRFASRSSLLAPLVLISYLLRPQILASVPVLRCEVCLGRWAKLRWRERCLLTACSIADVVPLIQRDVRSTESFEVRSDLVTPSKMLVQLSLARTASGGTGTVRQQVTSSLITWM